MAENPSNGHAPDGQQTHTNGDAPPMPRIAAPEGARSARAFDGSPIAVEEPAEITAFDDDLSDQTMVAIETDYRADLQDSFPRNSNGESSEFESEPAAPPLGISIEKNEAHETATHGFETFEPENFSGAEINDDPDPYRNSEYETATQAGIDAIGTGAIGADVIEGEQLFADDGAGGYNGGEPPYNDTTLATGGAGGRPDTPRDQEAGLFDHLNELRARLLHAILGVLAIMCVTWNYSPQLQEWFSAPIRRVLNQNGIKKGELMLTGAPDAFTVFFQFSLASALLLSAPWVLFQVWRFVEPALTNSERRYTLVLVPFSSVLFFLGAGLGYVVSPLFFQFFLQFQPVGVAAQWRYDDSILLMAKMLLIFGLAFQVPIIIIFGNKIGLLSRNLLIEYWRHAVVAIFLIVAILTPTWDPFTMTACALPPCLLYLLSIWLVKWL